MPVFLEGQDPLDTTPPPAGVMPPPTVPPVAAIPPSMQTDPAQLGIGGLIGAGLRQTPLGAAYVAATRQAGDDTPQDGYNAFEDPAVKGTPAELDYHKELMGMRNPSETAAFLANAASEEADRRSLAVSPGGTAVTLLTGLADPTLYIPFAGEAAAAGEAASLGYRIAHGAVTFGVQNAASQVLTRASQVAPPPFSVQDVATAAVFGGFVGGAAALLSPAERMRGEADLERVRQDFTAGVQPAARDLAPETPAEPPTITFRGETYYGATKLDAIQAAHAATGVDLERISNEVTPETTAAGVDAFYAARTAEATAPEEVRPPLGDGKVYNSLPQLTDKAVESSIKGSADKIRTALLSGKGKLPVSEREVNISDLVSQQDWIKPDRKGPALATGELPVIVSVGGRLVVRDGNHRIAELIDRGATTVKARVVEVDPYAAGLHSAGAAASDPRDMRLSSFLPDTIRAAIPQSVLDAGATLVTKASPTARVFLNGTRAGARAMGDLAETSLKFAQARFGVTASSPGTMPIDRMVRMQKFRLETQARRAVEGPFARYRGLQDQALPRVAAYAQDVRGQAGGLMDYAAFKKQVFLAMTAGDAHAVPEVQEAARATRKQVMDPVKKLAQDTIGPDGRPVLGDAIEAPAGDKSYSPRMWNKIAIAQDPNRFDSIVSDWLRSEQSIKADLKDRIERRSQALQAETDPALIAGHRADLENMIAQWQGNSVSEAKAALKAREKAYADRAAAQAAGTYKGKGERLTSADDAVDSAVKSILGSTQDLTPGELLDRAREIRNRINTTVDGRLPYDVASGGAASPPQRGMPGGPLNSRDFAISTRHVADFVHTDIEHVIPAFLRTILPDLHLTRRFGDTEMTDAFKRVNEEYDREKAAETNPKKQAAIDTRRQAEVRDLAATRDRVRGTFGMPTTPFQKGLGRVAKNVGNWNVGSMLGTSVFNRFQDMANATARRGMMGYMRDGFIPYFKALSGVSDLSKAQLRAVKDMQIGVDTAMGHLSHTFADTWDNHLPGNRFERGLKANASLQMVLTGHGPWTDMNKQIAGSAAMGDFLRTAGRIERGTQTAADIKKMAHAGIDPAMAARISRTFEDGGHSVVEGEKVPNVADWKDQGAADAFQAAIQKDADIAVITPGMEKPLFLSDPVGSMLGQFKGFSFAAQERILLSNMQEMDGRTLQGFLHMMAMGMLSYRAYTLVSGQPASERPQDWIKEAVIRAGMAGWMGDVNSSQAKLFGGKTDAFRLIGADKMLTRRQSESTIADMLGPTYAELEAVAGDINDASHGKWTAMDTHKTRQLLQMQNHFALRRLLDQAEDGFNTSMGIQPMNRYPTKYQ